LARAVDVVSIHAPLHPKIYHLFDEDLINSMRRGSYIVNTARAEIVVRDAVVAAVESGQLAGYAGDVWYPQPPAADHPWRTMPHEARYAAGTREILEDFLGERPLREEYLIVAGGQLAGTGAKSYTTGGTTSPGSSGR
jgi:formate dehydrogenase